MTRQGTIHGSTEKETELPYISCWVEADERMKVLDKCNRLLDMSKVTPGTEIGTVTFGSAGIEVEIDSAAIESYGYE